MKASFIFLLLFASCADAVQENKTNGEPDTSVIDTPVIRPDTTKDTVSTATFANERFQEVTVEQIAPHKFTIKGKAQVFEAAFSWVVEDGHNELKKGFEMTDAGAPAWGNFQFTVEVEKERSNSTLMLILFESSPKDGSRQYELPIRLY